MSLKVRFPRMNVSENVIFSMYRQHQLMEPDLAYPDSGYHGYSEVETMAGRAIRRAGLR